MVFVNNYDRIGKKRVMPANGENREMTGAIGHVPFWRNKNELDFHLSGGKRWPNERWVVVYGQIGCYDLSLSLSTRLFVGLNPSTKQAIGAMARHAILRPSCLRASLAAPPPLPPPASLPT